ncbi:hypothetical protein [Georgenia daeguensis]|uniref:Transposase n=1 Tax=Georgenia daeguensis TaxID=908355 RepID=A0ABP8EY36_9MICO
MTLKPLPDNEAAHTLTPDQYGRPVKKADIPVPALAWVRNGDGPHRLVDAVATAWTPRAVQVQYASPHGHGYSVWVWANAVIRRWDTE